MSCHTMHGTIVEAVNNAVTFDITIAVLLACCGIQGSLACCTTCFGACKKNYPAVPALAT